MLQTAETPGDHPCRDQLTNWPAGVNNMEKAFADGQLTKSKSQHFVPRVYLKQFRVPGTDMQIGIAKVEPLRIIGPGSIAGQCQESYFYGKNSNAELILKAVEDAMGPLFNEVESRTRISEQNRATLCLVVSMLYLRTRRQSELAKTSARYVVGELLKRAVERGELPPPQTESDYYRWDFSGVPEFLLKGVLAQMFEFVTLNCKLLRAAPRTSFVTSDNPTAVLNQYAYRFDGIRTCAGIAQCGVQVALPLSPSLCLFFYDPRIYKVGTKRRSSVQLSEADTHILNSLQIQSAHHCVYYSDPSHSAYVESLVHSYGHLRVHLRDHVKEVSRNSKETLLMHSASQISLPDAWSFVKYRKAINGKPGERRHPELTKAVEALYEDMLKHPDAGNLLERVESLRTRLQT